MVEVAAAVQQRAGVEVFEVEELHLGASEQGEASLASLLKIAPQHLAWVAGERFAVVELNVTEHPAHRGSVTAPRQDLEG